MRQIDDKTLIKSLKIARHFAAVCGMCLNDSCMQIPLFEHLLKIPKSRF